MKTWGIVAGVIILALAGFLFFVGASPQTPAPIPTATTTVTPSGTPPTATGTVPVSPPVKSKQGIVEGTVELGPTCPVERVPPDPNCAPKPYATTIRIQPANPSAPYTTATSNASGAFRVSLYPGTYTFSPQGGNSMPPTCRATQVVVTAGKTQSITLDCDTGIR